MARHGRLHRLAHDALELVRLLLPLQAEPAVNVRWPPLWAGCNCPTAHCGHTCAACARVKRVHRPRVMTHTHARARARADCSCSAHRRRSRFACADCVCGSESVAFAAPLGVSGLGLLLTCNNQGSPEGGGRECIAAISRTAARTAWRGGRPGRASSVSVLSYLTALKGTLQARHDTGRNPPAQIQRHPLHSILLE